MISLGFSSLYFCRLVFVYLRCHIGIAENSVETPPKEDKPISKFKVGLGDDDWLALPEVFSNLDFAADNSPASEDDIEGQLRLRSTRFWGRLYIDGWPQAIQFFRAHFGIEPPYGKKHFIFAEPRDACLPLTNANLTSEHVVIANRGTCTYGTKAKIVKQTAASAIIIINNEPGIDHLPGPDAHDIQLSVVSISQQEGALLESYYDDAHNKAGGQIQSALQGYIVPINCEHSGARCVPATYEERAFLKQMVEGGVVRVVGADTASSSLPRDAFPMEYLLAHFGTKVSFDQPLLSLSMAKPADACSPLTNEVRGRAVLIRRGNCPFVQKAEHVQSAGGVAMVVGSVHAFLLRMVRPACLSAVCIALHCGIGCLCNVSV